MVTRFGSAAQAAVRDWDPRVTAAYRFAEAAADEAADLRLRLDRAVVEIAALEMRLETAAAHNAELRRRCGAAEQAYEAAVRSAWRQ